MMTPLHLPDRKHITRIDSDDPLPYYYLPFTGWVYRRRLVVAGALLGSERFPTLLEIGYGSGVFLPELASHTDDLHAADIHPRTDVVEQMLDHEGVRAELHHGDILNLPFSDGQFDAVVCLSVLEHLTDLERALGEIARVLKADGVAVLGFPVRNVVTDGFYRTVGCQPRDIHPSSHRDILGAARPAMRMETVRHFPFWLPMDLSLYVLCRCRASR